MPQQSLDARHQFRSLERLRDIVVRPNPQPVNLVRGLSAGRQKQERCGYPSLPDIAAHIQAIAIRQHKVKNDQVIRIVGCPGETLIPSVYGYHMVSLAMQAVAQSGAQSLLVLYDQDALSFSVHDTPPKGTLGARPLKSGVVLAEERSIAARTVLK